MQKTKPWFDFFQRILEEWKSRQIFWFLGYMLRKFQGEPLKPNHVLAFCQASFLMTLSQAGFLTLAPGRGEGDNRAWGGGMVLPTWWAWVWASSRSWWWTGKPGMLQSMGWQRVRHNWETDLNFPSFEPVHCSMSGSNYSFLTCIRFLRRQVRWSGIPISWRIFQFVDSHSQKL